jgi:hypothetical protein
MPRSDATWPSVGLLLPGDHPEERRLAGAVRTDKPNLLAFLESSGRFDKEDLLAVLSADFVEAYHASAGARKGSAPLTHRTRERKRMPLPENSSHARSGYPSTSLLQRQRYD